MKVALSLEFMYEYTYKDWLGNLVVEIIFCHFFACFWSSANIILSFFECKKYDSFHIE